MNFQNPNTKNLASKWRRYSFLLACCEQQVKSKSHLEAGIRLHEARRIHHDICCLLLSSMESLQSNLAEFMQMLYPGAAAAAYTTGADSYHLEDSRRGAKSQMRNSKKRLSNMSDIAKVSVAVGLSKIRENCTVEPQMENEN